MRCISAQNMQKHVFGGHFATEHNNVTDYLTESESSNKLKLAICKNIQSSETYTQLVMKYKTR